MTEPWSHGFPFPAALRERFEPLGLLGAGGMGAVYLVRDRTLGRQVALKVILGAAKPQQVARFLREAESMASLRHPNVPVVHAFGHDGGVPHMVMEYLTGRSLAELPEGTDPLPPLLQVADALEAVHAAGLVHRDVKPANIMVEPSGRAVLVDFGLAFDQAKTALTETGSVTGTAAYLSPQRILGEEPRPEDDWYSWGVTLYTLLEGHAPFDLPALLRFAAGSVEPVPGFERVPADGAMAGLIRATLSHRPGDRPGSRADLEALLADDGRGSGKPLGLVARKTSGCGPESGFEPTEAGSGSSRAKGEGPFDDLSSTAPTWQGGRADALRSDVEGSPEEASRGPVRERRPLSPFLAAGFLVLLGLVAAARWGASGGSRTRSPEAAWEVEVQLPSFPPPKGAVGAFGDRRMRLGRSPDRLSVSGEGSFLASGHRQGYALWELATGERKGWVETSGSPRVAFLPGGRHLVAWEPGRGLVTRESGTGRVLQTVSDRWSARTGLDDMAELSISPDGRRVLLTTGSGSDFFEVGEGNRLVWSHRFEEEWSLSTLVDAGRLVALRRPSPGPERGAELVEIELAGFRVAGTLPTPDPWPLELIGSSDDGGRVAVVGNRIRRFSLSPLAFVGEDGWKVPGGAPPGSRVSGVRWVGALGLEGMFLVPGGGIGIAGSPHALSWSRTIPTSDELGVLPGTQLVRSSDASVVVLANQTGDLHALDAGSGKHLCSHLGSPFGSLGGGVLSPDGRALRLLEARRRSGPPDPRARFQLVHLDLWLHEVGLQAGTLRSRRVRGSPLPSDLDVILGFDPGGDVALVDRSRLEVESAGSSIPAGAAVPPAGDPQDGERSGEPSPKHVFRRLGVAQRAPVALYLERATSQPQAPTGRLLLWNWAERRTRSFRAPEQFLGGEATLSPGGSWVALPLSTPGRPPGIALLDARTEAGATATLVAPRRNGSPGERWIPELVLDTGDLLVRGEEFSFWRQGTYAAPAWTLELPGPGTLVLDASKTAGLLAMAVGPRLQIRRLSTGRLETERDPEGLGEIRMGRFLEDGRRFMTLHADSAVVVWDLQAHRGGDAEGW